jgi:hypothetical protein
MLLINYGVIKNILNMAEYNLYFKSRDTGGENIERTVWSFTTSDLELLVGMLAISAPLSYDLQNRDNINYFLDTDVDVSNFRVVRDIIEDDIFHESGGKLVDEEYGIWLRGTKRGIYDLYRFRTNSFFQGLVSICHKFQVDFRNYIYGLPFDGYGNLYTLEDYIMAPFQVVQDAPDLNDIEEEEYDNENIIQPYDVDGEIVTL